MKKLAFLFLLFVSPLAAQTVVPIVGGTATINMGQPNAGNSFKIFVTGAITVTVSGQPTANSSNIAILFQQDGSGHAVTFGTVFASASAPTIPTTASSKTSVFFQYDGTSNQWFGIAGTSGSAPGGTAGGVLSGTYPNPGFAAAPSFTTSVKSPIYLTTTKCSAAGSAANPSVAACVAAPSGSFSCATDASTATCQVNTTVVTAASAIIVEQTSGATIATVTCNTASDTMLASPRIASQSGGVSFTINLGVFTTNPVCFNYWIVN